MNPGESESSGREFTHDLFVSYASADLELVEPLVARLRESNFKVWFDRHDMEVTHDLASNLWNALQQCRQVLICLSDQYCTRDYTLLEMKLNFHIDPLNRRGRTIPALIRPLTKPVPPELVIIPWAELTKPECFEAEFSRLRASLHSASAPQTPMFATPVEVQALQRFDDPDKILVQVIRYAREIYAYIHEREVGGPRPKDTAGLAKSLTECETLPADVRAHVAAIQLYTALMEGAKKVERHDIDPGLRALLALSNWSCARYKPPMVDPFTAFWSHAAKELPSEDFPFQLTGGSRRITAAGAVYAGQDHIDGTAVDLLVAPLADSSDPFVREALWCASDASPLRVQAYKIVEMATGERWGLLALARPEGCSLGSVGQGIAPVPRLAGALIRQVSRAFQASHQHAWRLSESLFRAETALVDRMGRIRAAWNWNVPDPAPASELNQAGLPRESFAFSRAGGGATTGASTWISLRDDLVKALEGCPEISLLAELATAASPAEAVIVAGRLKGRESEDIGMLCSAAEALEDNRPPVLILERGDEEEHPRTDTPGNDRISQPAAGSAAAHGPSKAAIRLLGCLDGACQRAWPVGPDHVLLQDLAGRLAVWRIGSPGPDPAFEKPFRFRREALSFDGNVALGGWDGEICWFRAGGEREAACSLASAVGDLQWHGSRLVAGAWNGRLISARQQEIKSLLNVGDGVRRLAISSGDSFAALSLNGGVSIFRSVERKGQTERLPDAVDIAYAGRRLVLLTQRGLVTVEESGALSSPDRLPARGRMRLVSDPAEELCLLADAQGLSWIVDQRGTYPRGPRLPFEKGAVIAARGLKKLTAPSPQGGFACLHDFRVVRTWIEAVFASVSRDGSRVVVVLPGAVEIYEDTE